MTFWREVPLAVARGFAVFLGGFSLLSLATSFRSATGGSHWWIGFPYPGSALFDGLLLVSALLLLAFAAKPAMGRWRRRLTLGSITLLLFVALLNATVFLVLLSQGSIATRVPLPLSLLIAAVLGFVLWEAAQQGRRSRILGWIILVPTACFCTAVFPLSQMVFFGQTDYRRPADAAVVFGARAYADGRPSTALADRVRTACQLYLDGTVSTVVFSGGPGDGDIHETESMRQMALSLGVPDHAILLDAHGLNTEATVRNTIPVFEENEWRRVLTVSHAFHLPRIKMTYQRHGFDVYTVPAEESYILRQMPFLMFRETAAWWVYYLRPVSGITGSAAPVTMAD